MFKMGNKNVESDDMTVSEFNFYELPFGWRVAFPDVDDDDLNYLVGNEDIDNESFEFLIQYSVENDHQTSKIKVLKDQVSISSMSYAIYNIAVEDADRSISVWTNNAMEIE